MRHIANVVSLHGDPGFESRPLRHFMPQPVPSQRAHPTALGSWQKLLPGLLCAVFLLNSCRTRRILAVESVPPGALVRFDEEVIGRTPLEHEFVHYGKRRLTLYLPGHHTWSQRIDLDPPLRARFPLDVLFELVLPLGLTDRRYYRVEMQSDRGEEQGAEVSVDSFLERAWARLEQAADADADPQSKPIDGCP